MDPNATLTEIRREIAQTREALEGNGDLISCAEFLVDATEALDEWLTRGGFLPSAWEQTQPIVTDTASLTPDSDDPIVTPGLFIPDES